MGFQIWMMGREGMGSGCRGEGRVGAWEEAVLQRAVSTAQLPRAVGSPHPWGCSVTTGMWHWGTWAVGWAGVGLGISELFPNWNDSVIL